MWQEIRLSSLGVIADAELELGPGLTVITGETGAGKTMVVTALGLLRGSRADSGLVRHGADRLRVEATVDVGALPGVRALLDETPAETEGDELVLARTIGKDGRSRAYLGGASVPAGMLARLSEQLVAVHGQSDQHRLLRTGAQRAALDRFGDVEALLEDYRPAYSRLLEARRTLDDLTSAGQERARELDVLVFGLDEIAAVAPEEGEDDALRIEEARLAHAESLALAAAEAHSLLSDTDDASDVLDLLGRASALLDGVREHDPALDVQARRLDEVRFTVSDVAGELASYSDGVEVDPARLAGVSERRAALAGLTRKYGPTVADVLRWAEEAQVRVTTLQGDDGRIAELADEIAALESDLLAQAATITARRRESAVRLAAEVGAELEALAMPHARLDVQVDAPASPTPADLGPDGVDAVEMLLAANAGAAPRPLAKGASGGELSRVMLALEVVLADRASVPTFVFDEVDAGIGGRAAIEVGRRLARLAANAQVLVVTHLPQVAAFGDRHYHVLKSDDGTVTTSGVGLLDDDARVAELSRMLAGLEGSATAEAHARELVDLAAEDRALR
ncbi:DNA repair protein RecN [Mumia sp. zg.B53]|uniref:DNA repair protein RecN n=1 Tax=Mumia sp. zg.B53 TaxID=2855449 RepID=UPI001C6E3B73|nr:DNA repair protein RecN [Mumia sp. zg.B53]MBW9213672.1 DNA repair protein RecN [Mumia sp. zg.B53]